MDTLHLKPNHKSLLQKELGVKPGKPLTLMMLAKAKIGKGVKRHTDNGDHEYR